MLPGTPDSQGNIAAWAPVRSLPAPAPTMRPRSTTVTWWCWAASQRRGAGHGHRRAVPGRRQSGGLGCAVVPQRMERFEAATCPYRRRHHLRDRRSPGRPLLRHRLCLGAAADAHADAHRHLDARPNRPRRWRGAGQRARSLGCAGRDD
ncbi:MAG: hypothetical protein R2851_00985 [Caldilineaceae bacterium]